MDRRLPTVLAVLLVALAAGLGYAWSITEPECEGPLPDEILAIHNDQVGWRYSKLAHTFQPKWPASDEMLEAADQGERLAPALICALDDDERWVAAHVLLAWASSQEPDSLEQLEGHDATGAWDYLGLTVIEEDGGGFRYRPEERQVLKEGWRRWLAERRQAP